MISVEKFSIGMIMMQLALIPMICLAEDNTERDITLGRAGVLLGRASDGLDKLGKSRKAKVSSKWADEIQEKAADICSFVQDKLKKEHLDDKEMSLCSVE